MINKLSRIWPVILICLLTLTLFSPIFSGKLPFTGDSIIGAYYPWKDSAWDGYQRYPVKNFSMSDASNSFYPWRFAAINQLKQGEIPLWNKFEFSGTPLLAASSTGIFYPLNIVFFIFSFNIGWTSLVLLQPVLGGMFFYLFVRNKGLGKIPSLAGAICFSFGSYNISTVEFNVLGHTVIWLPLIFLSIDKFLAGKKSIWLILISIFLSMMIFAGFVQFVFYTYLLIFLYLFFQFIQNGRKILKELVLITFGVLFSLFLSAIQLIPFFEFTLLSSRIGSYESMQDIIYFLVPAKQLIMFFIPDYFGNPGTLNYFGKMNYYEYCGYFGIAMIFFLIYSIYWKKNRYFKETLFWLFIGLFSVLMAFENSLSLLPYNLKLPFISALIPARILILAAFSFPILVSIGFENFQQHLQIIKWKKMLINIFLICFPIAAFLTAIFIKTYSTPILEQRAISLRNMVLPSLYFSMAFLLLLLSIIFKKFSKVLLFVIILITCFDLVRQGKKFLSFLPEKLFYPQTVTTKFLADNLGDYRFMNLDQEMFGSNHQTVYQLPGLEGYNPLHNKEYSIFISSAQGDYPIKSLGTNFQRTVYGRNYNALVFDLLSVKYFLALEDIKSPNLKLVYQEKNTKIYENLNVMPRFLFTCNWEKLDDEKEILNEILRMKNVTQKFYLNKNIDVSCDQEENSGKIINTSAGNSQIIVETELSSSKLLVTSDIYFPGWKVQIDETPSEVLRVDYLLRGIVVPAGKHRIVFTYEPDSFKIGSYITLLSLIFSFIYLVYENFKIHSSSKSSPRSVRKRNQEN